MTTVPDKWILVKVTSEEHGEFYKIFATWSGSYLYGSSWQLNSGIDKVLFHDDHYEFQGISGSVYIGGKTNYGIAGADNWSVLSQLEDKFEARFHPLSEEEATEYLEGLK